ncbi:response regulator [Paenibacillus lignilyticus]|uniref:Response regulator n=1 Tax=Paenibacillus lignilyticus TaxID=1172615 RepID=A0ABS5CI69_9BACL|nr:response regulator [Paenibacillus lignilyticus]MBP3965577.1 response regulator [Paenibacillus lignilyticus]
MKLGILSFFAKFEMEGRIAVYTVLLADDERLDLEGLRRLVPWERMNMQVIAAVNSGFAALDFLNRQKVDILVTDVRMPRMTGLELARAALDLHPALKIVFVSGFEDFHYAKTALEMGASNYVLKPVDDEEFNQVMSAVGRQLDEEREKESWIESYTQSIPYLRNEFIRQWLEGTGAGDREGLFMKLERLGMSSLDTSYAAALLEVDDVSWKLVTSQSEPHHGLVGELQAFITKACADDAIGYPCKVEAHRMGIVVSGDDCAMKLSRLIQQVKQQFQASITIGIGSVVMLPEEIPISYLQARKALHAKLFSGKGKVITYEELEDQPIADSRNLDHILSELFKAATDYDLVKVDDCLLDLFAFASKLEQKSTVYNFLLHLISKLEHYLLGMNEDLYQMIGLDYQSLDILHRYETIDDIVSWFRRKLFEVSEKLHLKGQKKNRKLIEEVRMYIEQRLGTDVTLREVADRFSFSPNHLGLLFKEETGETFSNYLIGARMSAARNHLQDPKLKIYEVAHMAGYQNIAYFSRQFKEWSGMTPGDFRKQC